MNFKPHHLYINGKINDRRGLDLATNPFNGRVVGEVLLVLDPAFGKESILLQDEEITEEIAEELTHIPTH